MDIIDFMISNKYSLLEEKPRSKIPLNSGWVNGESLTAVSANAHIKNGGNLGVRTGVGSTLDDIYCLVAIDFDIRTQRIEIKNEAVKYLKSLLGDLSQYVAVISGSHTGSAHFYMKCEINSLPKSQYLINKQDWSILFLSTGKKLTIPPSIHPDTGKSYVWKIAPQDKKLLDIKTLPLWDAIKSSKTEIYEQVERIESEEFIEQVKDLPVSDRIKSLIENGDTDNEYPSRSEALYAAINALVAGNVNNRSILYHLSLPENQISECALERAEGDIEGAQSWILPQINKAHQTQFEALVEMLDEDNPPSTIATIDSEFGGLTPKRLGDFNSPNLPKTSWLIPNRLATKFITLTAAPGGSGKSTLTMQEAISIGTGIDCCGLGHVVQGPVWIFNNEDPYDELQRRVAAIAKQYNVPDKILRDNVLVNSGRYIENRLILAEENPKKGPFLYKKTFELLEQIITKYGFKLLIIDPFARCHYLNENNNSSIDMLIDALNMLADKTDCAINLVHHCKKLSHNELAQGNADAIRGASALVNSARIAHTLTTMTKSDAEKMGVPEDQLTYYSRLDTAKNNLSAPQSKILWYKKESVIIPNSEKRGVLVPWEQPQHQLERKNNAMINDILHEIENAWNAKDPYKLGENTSRSLLKILTESPYNLKKDQARDIIQDLIRNKNIANVDLSNNAKGLKVLNFE